MIRKRFEFSRQKSRFFLKKCNRRNFGVKYLKIKYFKKSSKSIFIFFQSISGVIAIFWRKNSKIWTIFQIDKSYFRLVKILKKSSHPNIKVKCAKPAKIFQGFTNSYRNFLTSNLGHPNSASFVYNNKSCWAFLSIGKMWSILSLEKQEKERNEVSKKTNVLTSLCSPSFQRNNGLKVEKY